MSFETQDDNTKHKFDDFDSNKHGLLDRIELFADGLKTGVLDSVKESVHNPMSILKTTGAIFAGSLLAARFRSLGFLAIGMNVAAAYSLCNLEIQAGREVINTLFNKNTPSQHDAKNIGHFVGTMLFDGILTGVSAMLGVKLGDKFNFFRREKQIENIPTMSSKPKEGYTFQDGGRLYGLGDYYRGTIPSSSSLGKLYADIRPSVVRVTGSTGKGTGFIVSEDGLVVTNHHVIKNSNNLYAVTNDGGAYAAKVVDSNPETDLALLQLVRRSSNNFKALKSFSNDATDIMTIGFPSTPIAHTASGKALNLSEVSNMTLLKMDCTSRSGMSGGPVCNVDNGKVIGVMAFGPGCQLFPDNISYAVLSKDVIELLAKYRTAGKG